MISKKAAVIYYQRDLETKKVVTKVLRKHKFIVKQIEREKATEKNLAQSGLVITVGGDGTFLRACHKLKNQYVLGVCSDLNLHEGYLTQACDSNFEQKLERFMHGKYRIQKLLRLQGIIDGKRKTEPALNEIYVGSKRPYHTAMYKINSGRKKEFQKSSGLLVYTPAGSSAWAGSVGAKKISIGRKKFHYVVREPYFGRITKPKMLKGSLVKNKKIKIISCMYDGIVCVDSSGMEHTFSVKSKLEIGAYKYPLNYIVIK